MRTLVVFSGALGGPMAALGRLIGENLGVIRTPIEVVNDGLRHEVRVDRVVDLEIEDVVCTGAQNGEPVRLTGISHPAGSELTVALATRSTINAFGVQYEANAGFSSPRVAWSA